MQLWTSTLRALVRPQRLVPILAVAVPLVVAQHHFSHDQVLADAISVLLVGGFLLIGPWSWRRFAVPGGLTSLLWPLTGLLPFAIGAAMSQAVEATPSHLLSSVSGVLSAALYLVGSWGLGRDLELEAGLDRMTERAETLALAARSAEILAMQAHLDPHFLFNTLNAIAEWCVVDGPRAERAVLDLATVLRQITRGIETPRWPLTEELDLARRVLELHQARDARFQLVFPAVNTACTVPPLLLLPLIENAMTHGPAKGHSGRVEVTVTEGPRMQVQIRNPGPYDGPREGGRGLQLVRDRAALTWGDAAHLDIRGATDETIVTLEWPRA